MRGGQEERKPQKMVRSSIACARCRRSKVKCVNTGTSSVCKACAQSNRECTYPGPNSSTPAPKRNENAASIKQESDIGENKKRVRKVEDTGRRNSQRPGEDVLDSPILTKKVWDELYEIFKLHFSTEMPFLHPPTFRNRMRQAAYPRDPSTPPAEIEQGRVLLLGVLTLTARFHPGLVAHHSQNGEDPLAASEYYATPLAAAFGPTIRNISIPSLENIQALLMLGLYEWGQTRGLSAWLYVGLAIRLAFSMGLAYEDDPDNCNQNRQAGNNRQSLSPREDAIEKEVRRRTLWSCFIMDRMLSAGKYRPTMMNPDKLRVQLPCSDDQFLFVHNVQTGFLTTDWMDDDAAQQRRSTASDDGALSRYIRLVEIFGRLSEYSYAGGRRTEKLPPWDDSTEFARLRKQLKDFHDALPPSLTFTDANLSAHIEKRNATTFASLHTLYSLCLIVLHREYIPFIPIRCKKPDGPLDEPTFPKDKYRIPPGFWEDSAEGIMKASRDIIQIVSVCQENDALPESPQIGFAVWQAAFVCVYAAWFPQMDQSRYLTTSGGIRNEAEIRKSGYPALTKRILGEMVPRLKMVRSYLRSIKKMHDYFEDVIRTYHTKYKKSGGGFLQEYLHLEKELKEFGDLKDADQTAVSLSPRSDAVDQIRSRASTSEIPCPNMNGEAMQGVEGAMQPRPNGAWAPINASSPPVEVDERAKYNYGPNPYGVPTGVPYQQSPNQSSNAPSLMSPSNGDSASGLNSPYGNPQGPPYHPSTQPHHVSNYPSIATHTMAPPTANMGGYTNDQDYEKWILDQESIRMNTGFDNFAQDVAVESWHQFPNQPNFLQAVHYVPQPVAGQTW